MRDNKSILRGLAALAAGLLVALQAAALPCASAGAFVLSGTSQCCAGLYKDANSRCQMIGCKKLNEAATYGNGVSNCCMGLVWVSGTCREPTLAKTCTILGAKVTRGDCCPGLVKDANGVCQRNPAVAFCSTKDIESPQKCCVLTSCTHCYCPSKYYR